MDQTGKNGVAENPIEGTGGNRKGSSLSLSLFASQALCLALSLLQIATLSALHTLSLLLRTLEESFTAWIRTHSFTGFVRGHGPSYETFSSAKHSNSGLPADVIAPSADDRAIGSKTENVGASSLEETSSSPDLGNFEKPAPVCQAPTGSSASRFAQYSSSVELYRGTVLHARSLPVANRFAYPVCMALVNLDHPPLWFSDSSASSHMTAAEARAMGDTCGPVFLLTNPASVGYEQNPISVYYCYRGAETSPGSTSHSSEESGEGEAEAPDSTSPGAAAAAASVLGPTTVPGGGKGARYCVSRLPPAETLAICIAEVTNTPWGDRVTFTFAPGAHTIAKPLHVSPFMDMDSEWHISSSAPGRSLRLTFRLRHPRMGEYFLADLALSSCTAQVLGGKGSKGTNGERGLAGRLWGRHHLSAALRAQWFLWLMPHRVAFWIYWQALRLWWKGVPLVSHPKYAPGTDYRQQPLAWIVARGASQPCAPSQGRSDAKSDLRHLPEVDGGRSDSWERPQGASEGLVDCGGIGGCPAKISWKDADKWPWAVR